MDKTVAFSVRSHFMDLNVLHDATVVPTTVITSAVVDNGQRLHQRVIHRQRQQVFNNIHDDFFSYPRLFTLSYFIHHGFINERPVLLTYFRLIWYSLVSTRKMTEFLFMTISWVYFDIVFVCCCCFYLIDIHNLILLRFWTLTFALSPNSYDDLNFNLVKRIVAMKGILIGRYMCL